MYPRKGGGAGDSLPGSLSFRLGWVNREPLEPFSDKFLALCHLLWLPMDQQPARCCCRVSHWNR